MDTMDRVQDFQREVYPRYEERFKELAGRQNPWALFIACSDSRVMPSLMMQAGPGDLFVCRNAGNIIPPHTEQNNGVTASVDYALAILKVPNIIVCGHSDCGAMKAVVQPDLVDRLPAVRNWLRFAEGARRAAGESIGLAEGERLAKVIEANVVFQLETLKSYPLVAAALEAGEVTLHGWTYDIPTGEIRRYLTEQGCFVSMGEPFDR